MFFPTRTSNTFPPLRVHKQQFQSCSTKVHLVLIVEGINGTNHFQEWTAYPQIPLKIGANFEGSEQNIFSYIVTINGVLYRLDLSLGDLPQ